MKQINLVDETTKQEAADRRNGGIVFALYIFIFVVSCVLMGILLK